MRPENLYNHFRWMWEEEEARLRGLRDLARTYVSLTAFYSAFVLFVSASARPSSFLQWCTLGGALGTMLGAFVLCLMAAAVADYDYPGSAEEIIASMEQMEIDDDEFFIARVEGLKKAMEQNALIIDNKATLVRIAGYLLLAGIALHAIYFLLNLT